jgi:hypothetical protein
MMRIRLLQAGLTDGIGPARDELAQGETGISWKVG